MTKPLYEKCPTCNGNAFEGLFNCKTCNGRGFVKSAALQDALEMLIDFAQEGIRNSHKHIDETYNVIQSAKRHTLYKHLHDDIGHLQSLSTQLAHFGGESTMALSVRERLQVVYQSHFGKRYEPESETE